MRVCNVHLDAFVPSGNPCRRDGINPRRSTIKRQGGREIGLGGVGVTSEGPDEADFERLAARVAMLASDDGEAANAGRAVAVMARRLGLTGGDLRAILLAGSAPLDPEALSDRDKAEASEREASDLRGGLRATEAMVRRLQSECHLLALENQTLKAALHRATASRRRWLAAIGVAGVAMAAGLVLLESATRPDTPRSVPGTVLGRTAVIRPPGAVLHQGPDADTPAVARLPSGTKATVLRLVWNALRQWAEVEANGRTGYVLTTELELS
jgi:hypothetical protein